MHKEQQPTAGPSVVAALVAGYGLAAASGWVVFVRFAQQRRQNAAALTD